MPDEILQLQSAQIGFEKRVLFRDLNLTLREQEILCLLGPSGGGKSTLLKVLAGLQPLRAGSVRWRNPNAKTGFVFQDSVLLPWKNVLENTRLPLELGPTTKVRSDEITELSREALCKVRLDNVEALYPHQLSGGMRMRVSIARALVAKPDVLFMDEPFAALDEMARFHLQEELQELARTQKMTVLFVTHSLYEAAFLADRIVILGKGQIVFDEPVQYAKKRDQHLRSDSEYLARIQTLHQRMAEL